MRSIGLLMFVLLFSFSLSKTTWQDLKGYDFAQYTTEYNKVYPNENEYKERRIIFEHNLATILAHNSDTSSTWKMGANHLTDRTNAEFRKLLGYRRQEITSSNYQSPYVPKDVSLSSAPPSVDWREKGVISDVKDQGQCGSCWAFGTAETVESYYALKTGQLHVLSEQQILDCTPNPDDCGGTGGCGGGIADIAYEKIIALGGLASEWTYPYVSYFGSDFDCHFKGIPPVAKLKGYTKLPSNHYASVIDALGSGPLVVNVDASDWHSFETGVFTGCNQNNSDINHVVELVGYGTDPKNGDYWLVRNSWTPSWGEGGYIRLARSSTVQCADDTSPGDGTGCNGGPSVVSVCGACGILYDASFPVIA